MSKLSSFLKGLKKAPVVLEALDEAGIDVDRLIGISRSQGSQGKIIEGILLAAGNIVREELNPVGRPVSELLSMGFKAPVNKKQKKTKAPKKASA